MSDSSSSDMETEMKPLSRSKGHDDDVRVHSTNIEGESSSDSEDNSGVDVKGKGKAPQEGISNEMEDAEELRAAGLVSKYARLDGDTAFSSREPRYPVTLEWRNVSYKVVLRVPPKNFFLRQILRLPIPAFIAQYLRTKMEIPILNNISGKVEAGKMIAIMGPTGSGKTTLLNVLARRTKMNVTGDILINGKEIKGHRLKRRMAYVLQDDVFFTQITVRDTLNYTAQLRLPRKLGSKEKASRVNEVLSELGLHRCAGTIIGGPFMRGVSGGERKRTNIANEIINNASLIFLDEPTSGLDASTAMGLIVTMKNLARHGHTVVTTIHQPSSAMFMLFDHVVLLAEGGFTVYNGSARGVNDYFGSLGLISPSNYNPADFMLELVTTDEKTDDGKPVKQYLIESFAERQKELEADRPNPSEQEFGQEEVAAVRDINKGRKFLTPFWLQSYILGIRGFKQRRGELINWRNTFQMLIIAFLVAVLWYDMDYDEGSLRDRTGLLFFMTTFWCMHSWMSSLYAFPPERHVLNKERASGAYRLSAYFVGKTLAEVPLELILPFMANTIIYWMTNLSRDGYTYILFLVLTWLMVIMGGSIGIAISAYFLDLNKGITFSIIIILISLLLGGFFINRDNLPIWIAWARWISLVKYSYESLLINEFKLAKDVTFSPSNPSEYTSNPITGQDVLDHLGVETTIWGDVIFLVGIITVARFFAYFSLRFLNKVKQ
eukprot:TRINITY_DN8165_c0_g1_i1.p1 TRINITY_DN8165_c0_g1~~TRINITY_DN8165_c0_g1_i1.p1  ORF type:complete len:719 (-),score=140.48 TRINITY_DN8165_c0_g1_i1:90-2246(-)